MNAVVTLAVALAISLAGNGWLAWVYLGQRDATAAALGQVTATTGERDDARLLASACSDAVDDLRELAATRTQEADAARQQAIIKASHHKQRADEMLAAPQAVPGNACASAQAAIDDWLKGRGSNAKC